ncbi:probable RNA-binding protein EIF1AD [Dendronephthya gigantea]|uniref:probable RNA-binding protein EIF1AD n=1 Tax=Dendronephthya gigantea TaxID=151771 RepID=UPI001069B2C1|nr:probable RNA-binding protein EIF1AD [Dendronephthya gigantea]
MSKATKRKHVTREVLDEFVTPKEKQIIVKIIGSRGNNLHEAETPNGNHFLISMPSKFRKNVWIKRGDFVIVDPIEEGNKVCAEIVHILYPQQVKHLKKEGLWPEKFQEKAFEPINHHEPTANGSRIKDGLDERENGENSSSDNESETDDSDLFVNPNHLQYLVIHSDDSDSCDEFNNEESDDDDSDADSPEITSNEDVAINKTMIDNNNTN